MFTLENSLRLPIGTRDVSANGTFLAGIASINMFNFHSSCFSLVSKKPFKLKEVPFMQVFALFFTKSYSLSNSGQVLKSNHSSFIERVYNLLGNYMVDIGSKTVLLLRNLLKVSFGRFCSTRLQGASQFLITLGNLFNLASAKKLIFRGNGNYFNSSINADNLAGKFRISNVLAENHVQENLIFSDKQVGGTAFPVEVLPEIFWHRNWNFDSTTDSKQGKFVAVKPDIVTSGIVTDRRLFGLRTGNLLFLSQSCLDRFKSFCGFHSGRYGKLRRKIFSCIRIGFIMQRHSVRIAITPTCLANKVKCFCIGLDSWFDNFYGNIKFKFNGSCEFHNHILNMVGVNVKRKMMKLLAYKARVSASLLRKERQ